MAAERLSLPAPTEAGSEHLLLDGRHGQIPARLWLPPRGLGPRPLVLMGHGAGVDKDTFYIDLLAQYISQWHDCPAVAIDAPLHGERVGLPPVPAGVENSDDSPAWWSSWATDIMLDDWVTVLDVCARREEVDSSRAAYWGLSMGCLYGVPLVAQDSRIRAAVLGLMGTLGSTAERLRSAAARITVPVFFLRQLDDEKVPTAAAGDLFEAIGSAEKELGSNPGGHADVPIAEMISTVDFIVRRLGVTPVERARPSLEALMERMAAALAERLATSAALVT